MVPTRARYRQLRRVVDRSVGYAHMAPGWNMPTVIAPRGCVTEADAPLRARTIHDPDHPDHVVPLTAAAVLAALDQPEVAALRADRAVAETTRDWEHRAIRGGTADR
jgi:hypothetical protein